MQRIAGSRWFGLADLILVGLSGVIWYFRPEAGGWPLLIALLPWGIRLGAGRFPFRNSSFDIPLIIFLITAGIGVWVAFNQEDAWVKFCVLVGAVFFFYALAGQPKENLWLVVGVLGLVGTAISLLFALTHDWRQSPTILAFFTGLVSG